MTISNWMMAIIKYENQLSVMSFPNVTSKTADAKPNPTTSNIIALILFLATRNSDNNVKFFSGDFAREKKTTSKTSKKQLRFALKQRKIDLRFNSMISI